MFDYYLNSTGRIVQREENQLHYNLLVQSYKDSILSCRLWVHLNSLGEPEWNLNLVSMLLIVRRFYCLSTEYMRLWVHLNSLGERPPLQDTFSLEWTVPSATTPPSHRQLGSRRMCFAVLDLL